MQRARAVIFKVRKPDGLPNGYAEPQIVLNLIPIWGELALADALREVTRWRFPDVTADTFVWLAIKFSQGRLRLYAPVES